MPAANTMWKERAQAKISSTYLKGRRGDGSIAEDQTSAAVPGEDLGKGDNVPPLAVADQDLVGPVIRQLQRAGRDDRVARRGDGCKKGVGCGVW